VSKLRSKVTVRRATEKSIWWWHACCRRRLHCPELL